MTNKIEHSEIEEVTNTDTPLAASLPVMLLIICVAAAIRIGWLWWFDPIVDNEGATYVRLAENLRDGHGYIGLFGERHTLAPPLYPLLIAGLSYVTHNGETAARIISLVLGTLTVIPIYGIASRLGGPSAGAIAGAITAVHGLFVVLSGSAYSESTYFFFAACGIYCSFGMAIHRRFRAGIYAGLWFGLAYLVRPEAIVYPFIAAGFAFALACWQREGVRVALAGSLVMLVLCGLIISPYVGWLTKNSGYLRFDGKSYSNAIISERIREGQTYYQASRGIGADLQPVGVYFPLDQFALWSANAGNTALAIRTIFADLPSRVPSIAREVVSLRALGWLPMLGLAGLGVVVALMRPNVRSSAILFALFGASYLVALLSIQQRFSRHIFPFAFLLLPWSAVGAATLLGWLRKMDSRHYVVGIAAAAVLLAIAFPSAVGSSELGEFTQMRDTELRDAGLWLREQGPNDKLIAGTSAVLPYYANARWVYLPWAEESLALAFLRKVGPDYVIVTTQDTRQAPYVSDWLARGLQSDCAGMPIRSFVRGEDKLYIYRWTCPREDPHWLDQACDVAASGTTVCRDTPPVLPRPKTHAPI